MNNRVMVFVLVSLLWQSGTDAIADEQSVIRELSVAHPGWSLSGHFYVRYVLWGTMRNGALPQSGFGGLNIPAGGRGRKGPLAPGVTTGMTGILQSVQNGKPYVDSLPKQDGVETRTDYDDFGFPIKQNYVE
jgi:hypothetical protein